MTTPPLKKTAGILLDHLCFYYPKTEVFSNFSLSITQGEKVAIVGPNGSGKSTLVRLLVGLEKPVCVKTCRLVRPIGYLPQRSQIDTNFPITVEEVIYMGVWKGGVITPRRNALTTQHFETIVEALNLGPLLKRPLNSLSGGQFQKTLFGRLWAQDHEWCILDEPFTAIDEPTIAELLKVLDHWSRRGKTIIAVLHDNRLVSDHFTRTVVLEGS